MNKKRFCIISACFFTLFATSVSFAQGTEEPRVNTSQSLTKNLKNNAPDEIQDFETPQSGNWLHQLIDTASQKVGFGGRDDEKPSANLAPSAPHANASVFNIAGVMLRMSYEQAEQALLQRGYRKTTQKMDIPNFIRWRGEDMCRNQGVIGYERLENCVIKLAKEGGYQFISEAQFNKYDTQETVHVYLTSSFSGNKIYKITYQSEAANVTGNSAKARYLRNIKVYDFWKKINQKYGAPDNKEDVIWGLGGNQAYMKGETGRLLLEDPLLRELDFTRMSREDQRFMNTDVYTF